MARTRRSYTPEFKAQVLAYFQEHGGAATATQFDLPDGTVATWAHRGGVKGPTVQTFQELADKARASRATRLQKLADDWLTVATVRMDKLQIVAADEEPRTMTWIAAVATDKTMKLGGEEKPDGAIRVDVRVPQLDDVSRLAAAALSLVPAMRGAPPPTPQQPRDVIDVVPCDPNFGPPDPTAPRPVEPDDAIAEAARAAQQQAALRGKAANGSGNGSGYYGPPSSWRAQDEERRPRRFEP
jgi:transposase-like protein